VSDNLLRVNPATTDRKTAEQRREALLDTALTEFGDHGFEGASTDAIARAAGISQPYLFRLFRTKKELFIASIESCFGTTYARFAAASDGLHGEDALEAMGRAYKAMIAEDPRRLRMQMQSYAACDDPETAAVVRRGFGRLVDLVESKGADPERAMRFFSAGMLINVMASMGVLGGEEPWAATLIAALMED
jgi:AcrR family transcriptional regulator